MDIRDLYHFTGLLFTDMCVHAHYAPDNHAYFAGVVDFPGKTAKIKSLEKHFLAIPYYI